MLSTLEFASKIAWMRAELRDLKTAHERGLGLIDFFKASTTLTASSSPVALYKLTVTIADSYVDVFPPLLQIAFDPLSEYGLTYISEAFDQDTLTFTMVFGGMWNPGDSVNVSVISSAKIATVTVEEQNA